MEYIEETALQKEPEITVLKVEPGKAPEEVTIPNTLEAMQQMVGGLIEIVYLDGVCLVCNEEGKLVGLEGNRRVGRDIISGTFFLAGDTDYGEFCSLTQEQLDQFSQRFAQPETFRPKEDEMEKIELKVSMEPERLDALRYFLQKQQKGSPQKELERALEELYETYVPADTRAYLDSKCRPVAARPRPKRPVRSAQAKSAAAPATAGQGQDGEQP